MNKKVKYAAILFLAGILSLSGFSGTGAAKMNVKESILKAKEYIEKEDYGSALTVLIPLKKEDLTKIDSSQIHYLLGSATYHKTFVDIDRRREKGIQKRDELKKNQVSPLKEALDYFVMAYEMDPKGEFAAGSLYMSGKTLDWGGLQRWNEALEYYNSCAELFPNTENGEKCIVRYKSLKALMSPHGRQVPHGTSK